MKNKQEKNKISKIDNILNTNMKMDKEVTISSLENTKETVKNILQTNKESVESSYKILDKELDKLNNKDEIYEFCKTVKDDCKKALENENLTSEERDKILDREMKIIEMLSNMEKDIQESNKEVAKMAVEKDSENKKFLWGVLGVSVSIALTVLGIKNHNKNK